MHSDELYDDLEIVRYKENDGFSDTDDQVVRESMVRIFLNDQEIVALQALKNELIELAVGFLYTECLIDDIDSIRDIDLSEGLDAVHVTTDEDTAGAHVATVRSITSGCGKGVSFVNPLHSDRFNEVDSEIKVQAGKVTSLMRELLKSSTLFESTGAVHSAALSDGEKIVHLSDDIGRHNCIDKIAGWELTNRKVDPSQRLILSSGRLSSDIIAKSVRLRAPVVASHSAPTMGAVQLAVKFGVTLIGFVRGRRFNIYTNRERIEQ